MAIQKNYFMSILMKTHGMPISDILIELLMFLVFLFQ